MFWTCFHMLSLMALLVYFVQIDFIHFFVFLSFF